MYKVRVKDGATLGGHSNGGARLTIMPGTYDVEKIANGDLVFKSANSQDSSDLVIHQGEYLELDDFPNVSQNPYIEIVE